MSSFCTHCGTPLPDGSQSCPACGRPSPAQYARQCHQKDHGLKENFFRWHGRLNRKRYFLRSLALIGLSLIATVLFAVLFWATHVGLVNLAAPDDGTPAEAVIGSIGAFVLLGYILFLLFLSLLSLPGFFLGIRRCHDIGHSGYMVLVTFIPIVGWLFPFYLLLTPGDPGPNPYGPDPLDDSSVSETETNG